MQRNQKILWIILIGVKFLIPFLIPSGAFEMHRDEYLYYAQGQHLAPGFLENPSLIGILAWLSSLAGGTHAVIAFWPAITGAATLWLALRMTKGFGGGFYAQLLTGLGFLFSAFLRIHLLFQPNFLDIFFWTLAAFFAQRFLLHNRNRDLYGLALALALGWWSKYSILFFAAALLLAILLGPQRRWLAQRRFWLSAGTALLLVLPNIIWQYMHQWPLAQHMNELRETQLRYVNKADFLKEQVLMFVPSFFLCIGGLIWLLRRQQFRFFGWLYLGVIGLLLLGSGKGYYALGIYPMLLAAGGAWMERAIGRSVFLRALPVVAILVLAIPIPFLLLPLQAPAEMAAFNEKWDFKKLGILRWEDQQDHPLQQDFADMIGWREIARKTERFYNALPDSVRSQTAIYASNYGYAGSLSYYIHNEDFRCRLICANGTFLLWIPDRLPARHLLYVSEERPKPGDELFHAFGTAEAVDSCTNKLSRQFGTMILFFRNPGPGAFPTAEQVLLHMKARFRR